MQLARDQRSHPRGISAGGPSRSTLEMGALFGGSEQSPGPSSTSRTRGVMRLALARLATVAAVGVAASLSAVDPHVVVVPVVACAVFACATLPATIFAFGDMSPEYVIYVARTKRAALVWSALFSAVRMVTLLYAVYLIGPARTLVASGGGIAVLAPCSAALSGAPLDRRRTLRTALLLTLTVCLIAYDASGGRAPAERAKLVSNRVLQTHAGHAVRVGWDKLNNHVRERGIINPFLHIPSMQNGHINLPFHAEMPSLPVPQSISSAVRVAQRQAPGTAKQKLPALKREASVAGVNAQPQKPERSLLQAEDNVADNGNQPRSNIEANGSTPAVSAGLGAKAHSNDIDIAKASGSSKTTYMLAICGALMSFSSFATLDFGVEASQRLALDISNAALAQALTVIGAMFGIIPFAILSTISMLYQSPSDPPGNIVRVVFNGETPSLAFLVIAVPQLLLADGRPALSRGSRIVPDRLNRRELKIDLQGGLSTIADSLAGDCIGARAAYVQYATYIICYPATRYAFEWAGFEFESISFTLWLAVMTTAALLHLNWRDLKRLDRRTQSSGISIPIQLGQLPLLAPAIIPSPSIPRPIWRMTSNVLKSVRQSISKAAVFITQTRSHRASSQVLSFLVFQTCMVTVETAYAFWTDSVGLISISADNLFCCTALAAGLLAARASFSRVPSTRFSYGLTRLESLCGFVNGLLLLVVAILIFLEAIDRTFNPEYIDMSHIFAVCFCGITGNGLGLIFFPRESRRENHNVLGIYLHILANTLAYVGITTSTVILGINPGWAAAELIVALFVAMVVVTAALPLLFRSGRVLMNVPPSDLDGEVQAVWNELCHLEGVTYARNFRVWHLNPTRMMACVHLGISSSAQLREGDILRLTRDKFQSIGISRNQVTIQISIEDSTGISEGRPKCLSNTVDSGESSAFHG